MYLNYFGLAEHPFSIAPDPSYLFMSERHRTAMAHLSYGLSQGGCFLVLTGEVGTGKTTLCRNLLKDLPDNVDVALILNANINDDELLQTISDELRIDYTQDASQKQLLDSINRHLLSTFAQNRRTVLIIDEAQLLSRDVLEQVRILTNLETTKHKLLQIILIGQSELNTLLRRNDLRQLAQRVTARYNLGELQSSEMEGYVNYRLAVAGCRQPLFSRKALKQLHALTDGIPRKINVLADHSLLSAYANNQSSVESKNVKNAAKDVFFETSSKPVAGIQKWWMPIAAGIVVVNCLLWLVWFLSGSTSSDNLSAQSEIESNSIANVQVKDQEQVDFQEANEPVLQDLSNSPSLDEIPDQSAPVSVESESDTFGVAVDPSDSVSVLQNEDQSWQVFNNQELASILRSDDVSPGSVVIAEELLDDSPPDLTQVASNNPSSTSSNPANLNQGWSFSSAGVNSSVGAYDINSDFAKVLDSSSDITGRSLAFRNLAQAWDVTLPLPLFGSACRTLLNDGVACLDVVNWQQLERYNRPSILVVQQADQLHRVIVFALEGNEAQVLVGENVHTVSQSELRARWNGNGITFWQPGGLGQSFLKVEDIKSTMPSVRRRLNQTLKAVGLEQLDNESNNLFDQDMSQKVFALQSLFGIRADSVIGPETYLLMNELLEPDSTPVLRARARRT